MITNWVEVYSSKHMYKIEMIIAFLKDNEINAVIVNKMDSSYLFGEIEVHVQPDDVIIAKQLINKFENE